MKINENLPFFRFSPKLFCFLWNFLIFFEIFKFFPEIFQYSGNRGMMGGESGNRGEPKFIPRGIGE